MLFQHHATSGPSTLSSNYPSRASPFTPSQTPTFKRVVMSPHHRSKSSPAFRKSQGANNSPSTRGGVKIQPVARGNDDVGAARHHERPHTVAGGRLMSESLAKNTDGGMARSRKVWDKPPSAERTTSNKSTKPWTNSRKNSSTVRNNQRAKYVPHPLMDPKSRCSSSLVSKLIMPRTQIFLIFSHTHRKATESLNVG